MKKTGSRTLSVFFLFIVFRKYPELLLKAFGKIGRGIEAHHVAYFVYSESTFQQQKGCLSESFHLDEAVGTTFGDSLDLSVQ